MAGPEDRIAYLQRYPARLEIGRLCRGRSLTEEEIAKELGRSSGGISSCRTMEKDGVLETAGGAKGQGKRGGGVRFRLTEEWWAAVETCLAIKATGTLAPDGDILLLQSSALRRAWASLREESGAALWGAPLVGEHFGLLLFVPNSGAGVEAIRLISGLADQGVETIRLHIPKVLDAGELREWAADVADGSAI